MNAADLEGLLNFSRRKTLELLNAVGELADPADALGWRPGAERAHLAWQFLHLAATDDRHLHVRMTGGEPQEPELVRRFAGGSIPDDQIPPIDTIRTYLTTQRQALLDHLHQLSETDLVNKPHDQAQWTYAEWFQLLAWHEAHHHGQAHLTFNLYRASHDSRIPRVGH